MRRHLLCVVLLAPLVIACHPENSATPVMWDGHALQVITSLNDLPAPLKTVLGVGRPGLDGVADHDERFNPTDVVDSTLPMRRFLIAGHDRDIWLVALEHGGIGYYVEAFLFLSGQESTTKKWVLSEKLKTLSELVRQIDQEKH